jgi:uncharacterized protein YjdB
LLSLSISDRIQEWNFTMSLSSWLSWPLSHSHTRRASVTVTVVQTVTSLSVTPSNVTLAERATQQFTATALDQFGSALTSPPTFTWQVSSGGGTISRTGLYRAPKNGTGSFEVTVSADGLSAVADVTVVA